MSGLVARGYTIVELMMSLSVLAIGASGVIAMQRVTLASNQHAKNLAVATGIAEAWADALAADGTQWNSSTDLATDTEWLRLVADAPLWIRPAYAPARQMGPGFGPLGDPTNTAGLARFCTDLRFTWMRRDTQAPGAGLIRAEIRVFWKRDNAVTASALPANLCDDTNPPATVDTQSNGYHFVMVTTAIAQQGGR